MKAKYLVALIILAVCAVLSISILYLRRELLTLTGHIRPGMTAQDVLRIAGKPRRIYTAEQIENAYRGY